MSRRTVYAVGAVGFLAAPLGILMYGVYHEPPAVVAMSKAGEVLSGWGVLAICIFGCMCAAFVCWMNDGTNDDGGGRWDPPDDQPEPDPEPDPAAEAPLDRELREMQARENDPWAPPKEPSGRAS